MPVVIILAIISFVIWQVITKDFSYSINIFISILVIACPCSLGLATPLAIVIASGLCSQKGILVKTSETLENANNVKTVVFDKTGTLTKGNLSISKIYNYSNEDENNLIRNIASIENKSEHPIAKGIVNYAKEKNIELIDVATFKSIPGYGLQSKIEDDEYYIGNKKLIEENGVQITEEIEKDEIELEKEGNSILFVAKNNILIALIGIKDIVRENAKETIEKLKDKNINVVMLTGDNEAAANLVAKEIGIEKVISNVRPKEKAEKIKELKKDGLVMMMR